MMKKTDFDSTVKKVESLTNKADIIMRNRIIIAIFLIVDGLTFVLNPSASLTGLTRNIIIFVLIASFSTLIANLSAKVKDKKSIIVSIVIIIIGIIMFIYPDFIAAYVQILFALFIIYEGTMNIIKALNLNKLSGYTQAITKKIDKFAKHKDSNSSFDEGFEEQKEKFMNPLKRMVGNTNKTSILYIVINAITVILGFSLLLFSNTSIIVCGIIFIYTGVSDLLFAMKAMNISKKIKEKKYSEILFDENKEEEDEKDEHNKTEKE